MLKCKITTKTPNWETKKMDSITADYIVASTKSLRIVLRFKCYRQGAYGSYKGCIP